MDLDGPFFGRMAGDEPLNLLVARYPVGEETPAIFTFDPIPEDAVFPFIVTSGNEGDEPADTKTTRGRDIDRRIRCYDEAKGDPTKVDAIAERIRELFHRQPLVVPGFGTVLTSVSGPRVAPADEDIYGRYLIVRLLIEKNP